MTTKFIQDMCDAYLNHNHKNEEIEKANHLLLSESNWIKKKFMLGVLAFIVAVFLGQFNFYLVLIPVIALFWYFNTALDGKKVNLLEKHLHNFRCYMMHSVLVTVCGKSSEKDFLKSYLKIFDDFCSNYGRHVGDVKEQEIWLEVMNELNEVDGLDFNSPILRESALWMLVNAKKVEDAIDREDDDYQHFLTHDKNHNPTL